MPVDLCVLNLTSGERQLTIVEPPFVGAITRTSNPYEIPDLPEPLILYVVAHAIPDALNVVNSHGNALSLTDQQFADAVTVQRKGKETLIILDLCFAKSFAETRGAGWEGIPNVLIFGCDSYEQAWHTGRVGDNPPKTLFSIALDAVLRSGVPNWAALESALVKSLSNVQHPSIPSNPSEIELSQFGWAQASTPITIGGQAVSLAAVAAPAVQPPTTPEQALATCGPEPAVPPQPRSLADDSSEPRLRKAAKARSRRKKKDRLRSDGRRPTAPRPKKRKAKSRQPIALLQPRAETDDSSPDAGGLRRTSLGPMAKRS
jgi:hypothetical protein